MHMNIDLVLTNNKFEGLTYSYWCKIVRQLSSEKKNIARLLCLLFTYMSIILFFTDNNYFCTICYRCFYVRRLNLSQQNVNITKIVQVFCLQGVTLKYSGFMPRFLDIYNTH